MEIQFVDYKKWGIKPKIFDKYIDRLKKIVPETKGTLNVVFVNNPYIRELNKRYRNNNKPTDVLSFSYVGMVDFREVGFLGEIYISVPMARKQAREYKWRQEQELSKLFVHGFLHIFGYDHETEEDYKKMSKVEKRVLT